MILSVVPVVPVVSVVSVVSALTLIAKSRHYEVLLQKYGVLRAEVE